MSAPLGAAPLTKADLTKAHELRQQRKYADARSRFSLIAKRPETPLPLRQEAGYWMGYCSVMEQAFLKAIQDFR